MARVPKYINNLIEEEKSKIKIEKAIDKYSIAKKINKSSNNQLLSLFLHDQKYRDGITDLYRSNPSYKSWQDIRTTWNTNANHNLFHYLQLLLKVSDNFLDYENAVATLNNIIVHKDNFVRPFDEWKPKSRNAEQQVRSLIRHLFAKYPTPTFLEKYFFVETTSQNNLSEHHGNKLDAIKMYLHMGSGKSMKSYEGYPLGMVIHKKAAHHLYTTPEDLDLISALRRIQVLYLGGDKYIFRALMRANVLRERVPNIRIRKNGSDEWEQSTEVDEFWISVMKFFIDNPMIEPDKISEIIDYINNMKFLKQRTYVDGRYVTIDPPHPTFTMKGRTPVSILNQSNQWHYERNRLNRENHRNNMNYRTGGQNYSWSGVNIKDGEFRRSKVYKYKVIQLCTYFELRDEGNEMHHCVATYASSCSAGRCSIFSVREYIEDSFNCRTATIEVRGGSIVQIRAKYNKKPNDTTISVIKEWADYEKLTISQYAL